MNLRLLGRVAIAVILLGAAGFAASRLAQRDQGVPTFVVESSSFRIRVTAEGNLEAVTSTPIIVPTHPRRPRKIAWLIADGSLVSKGEIVARFDSTDLEKDLEDGRSDRLVSLNRIASAEVDRDVAQEKLNRDSEVSQQELINAREFQASEDSLFSRMEIVESQIDTELAEKKAHHAEASKEIRDHLAETGIDLLEIERRKAELKIQQAEDGLVELQIAAPNDGIVVISRDWRGNTVKVGDTVWPGRPVASIPDLAEMQAEVFVLEADAGGLEAGQPGTVVVEAWPDFPRQATVKSVDPVAQRKVRWVPVQYFRAVMELESTESERMKPGSRVHAEIVLADLEEAIAIPRQAVFVVDGRNVVWLRKGSGFEEVEVETGVSATGRVVIINGLQPGDVIALRDPHRDPRERDRDEPDEAATTSPVGGPG